MSRIVRFDKVAVGEISVNFLGATHTMVAKAKLVSSRSGASFGSTTIQHWPPQVLAKLEELRHAMEEELDAMFFDESRDASPATSSSQESRGLAAFLEDRDPGMPA